MGTWFWWLGVVIGVATAGILFVADLFPREAATTPLASRQPKAGAG